MKIFQSLFSDRGSVVISGREYVGSNISIVNGHVTVDGVTQDKLESYHVTVEVRGNPKEVSTTSGNILVSGNVHGDVETKSGNVACGAVGGNVSTMSGDVKCGRVEGRVSTMSGDINHT